MSPYRPAWADRFRREARRIRRALGSEVGDLQHIGSTAVPGLPAKPVLDIAVAVRGRADRRVIRTALEDLGYRAMGTYGLPGRRFFRLGDPLTIVHLHVVHQGSPHWDRWLRFRDLLRTDEQARAWYAAEKRKLARRYAGNRAAYTKAKGACIGRLLGRRG